jgi:hypothetical protein
MKNSPLFAVVVSSACCLFAIGSPLKAFADPIVNLHFESVGPGNSADGYYTYPYEFSVDGSSTLTSLMCVSFNNEITFGESWKATPEAIAGTQYEEAAWLYNDAATAGNVTQSNEDQLAAWYLLSGDGNPANGNNAQLADAIAFVALNPNDSAFYSKFELYVPVGGSQSSGGIPQTFIGETPEPSSLLLFGSGLLASAVAVYRKRRVVQGVRA